MVDESGGRLEKQKDGFREKVKSVLDAFLKEVALAVSGAPRGTMQQRFIISKQTKRLFVCYLFTTKHAESSLSCSPSL